MANLMEMLQGQLTESLVSQLSQQIGGASPEQTTTAANSIMSTLMGALAKNASTTEGANSLLNALDKDHDGSVLDNITSLIGGGAGRTEAQVPSGMERALNGAGIIKHLLGNRQSGAIDMISQMSGLKGDQTGNLMQMLAPMVMGMLGRQKKQGGLDIAGLASLLSGNVAQQKQTNPAMGLITSFLDKDGDGDIKDEIASMGMRMLGNFFKK